MKGKICRFISGLLIATTMLTSCSAVADVIGSREENNGGYTQSISTKRAVELAQKDMPRFEAIKRVPIDIIVDEDSNWGMIEKVQQAIKNTINQYNEMFSYINPDYQLRYISKKEYEKNITDNPFVLVTTELRIQTQAGSARAVTSPPKPTESKYGNGSVYSNSVVIVSSTGTVNMTIEEIQNVISHEFGHVFGILTHTEDEASMMSDTSNGVTVSSKEFSLDMLTSFKEMYYNPKTNTVPEYEIDKYIVRTSSLRQKELEEYLKTQETGKPNVENEENSFGQAQEEKADALKNFKANLTEFLNRKELKSLPAEDMIGAEFSDTSIYGQTREIAFNEDGTYTMRIYDTDRFIECVGTYSIKNGVVICSGEYFEVDEEFNYVKTQDKLYFSATETGCVYATESNNGTIYDELKDTSLIEGLGV